MRNLKLVIEYDGTNYCGWQVQRNHKARKSIQETIESALQQILQEKICLIASSRTDAGVHALAQVANFKTGSKIATDKLQKALNGLLPDDITINRIEEADAAFHSRFSAKSKVYRYLILNCAYPSALLRERVYYYPSPLDIQFMQRESRCLLGKHNFKSFSASNTSVKNTIRTIKKISISKIIPLSLIVIDIEADGFLYNMVRNIVGTLIEAGRGKLKRGNFKKVLLSRDRRLAGPKIPARGLYLLRVNYD